MDKVTNYVIIILLLLIVSLILVKLTNKLYTKQESQESKILVFLKLVCELFIIFLILFYSSTRVYGCLSNTNLEKENPLIVLLCSIFTLVVYFRSQMYHRANYLYKNKIENFEDCVAENSGKKTAEDYNYNPYREHNQPFNTTWRNFNNKDYIFDVGTKDYWNTVLKYPKDYHEDNKVKDYDAPFSKYTPLTRVSEETSAYNKYKFSNSYPPESETEITTIDNILKIVRRNDITKSTIVKGDFTIDNVDVGDKVRLKDGEIVNVTRIFGNNIEYLPDYEDYNITPMVNNNTNLVENNNNGNNSNSNNRINTLADNI